VEGDYLVCLAQNGYRAGSEPRRHPIGVAPNDAYRRVVVAHETVYGTPDELHGGQYRTERTLKTAILLPVIHREIVIGVLQLEMERQRDFAPDDLHFLRALANAAASSVQNARLFEETDRQRLRLQALDNEKDEFISVITHELKNPLASIKGYAGLLARRARKDPNLAAATKSVDVIQQQVSRMTLLLDQLRDVSHIGINRFAVEPQGLDLVPIVQHVANDAQTTTTEHIIEVEVRDPVVPAWGDVFRIEQVLSNLVGNAIKYTPEGGRIELVVGCGSHMPNKVRGVPIPDDWAVVTVRDHGIGIPEAEQDRLFERFFRAGNAKGKVSGMGLGLYIAREIIQRHGGMMWVESEEGRGSLFGVTLPPVPDEASAVLARDTRSDVLVSSQVTGS
jgi:signal transduction histidine kinase